MLSSLGWNGQGRVGLSIIMRQQRRYDRLTCLNAGKADQGVRGQLSIRDTQSGVDLPNGGVAGAGRQAA